MIILISFDLDGKCLACTYRAKFVEVSVGIHHNVDELLAGTLTQIRLKKEQNALQVSIQSKILSNKFLKNCTIKLFAYHHFISAVYVSFVDSFVRSFVRWSANIFTENLGQHLLSKLASFCGSQHESIVIGITNGCSCIWIGFIFCVYDVRALVGIRWEGERNGFNSVLLKLI